MVKTRGESVRKRQQPQPQPLLRRLLLSAVAGSQVMITMMISGMTITILLKKKVTFLAMLEIPRQ